MNRLQLKFMVLTLRFSCYVGLLAAPDKTFQDFCQFGASLNLLLMMCHTATKASSTLIDLLCDNRLCWWTSGMNKSMLDLYKKLDSQERGEKREKRWTRKWIYSPSLLYFPLSLLFLSHKYSSLLTTWQEAINTQILEYFVKAKLLAVVNFTFSFFETLIQKLVTHCHYYFPQGVPCSSVPNSNCACPHGQAEATGCQPSMAASSRMKRFSKLTVNDETCKSWSSLITKDKTTDGEAMHFFTTESGSNVVAYGWMTTLSTFPNEVLSADIGRPFTWCGGVCKRNGDQPLLLQAGISRRAVKANDRHCLDCPLHTWRASKVDP